MRTEPHVANATMAAVVSAPDPAEASWTPTLAHSVGQSTHAAFPIRAAAAPEQARPSKRVSPGLELRVRRLEQQRLRREAERRRQNSIGRIPEEQLAELERLHGQQHQQQRVIEVRRRGRAWSGPPVRVMPAAGGVRLDGGPMLSEAEASTLDSSDVSSIISISEPMVASDSDEDGEGGELLDKQKYRMPDVGKTRLHLRTREPLSPTSRHMPRSSPRRKTSTPTTPTMTRSAANAHSPTTREASARNGNGNVENVSDGDFVSSGISRTGSVCSLSRASFTGQLSQLTSMRLPDANSLGKRISSIPSSAEAARALSDASEQIRMWIGKASEVLSGLEADDDVEWAAAGGRDGIDHVDTALNRFERLVQVYILSIERLQMREDVAALPPQELLASVKQMEGIIASWQKVKDTLKNVREQVEIALEWEELWNSVLGQINQELEGLNRLVFEMEEKRHQGAESLLSTKDSIDLHELETIVEERPGKGQLLKSNRFSFPPFSPTSPIQPPPQSESREDSSLLALFARMQPLRASLDFLPMRLSVFHCRGNPLFPSACLDLEQRRDQLEVQWKKLEDDAEALRRELGEDRWVLVFRNAGRQALKMCESITRSFGKLKDAIDAQEHQTDMPSMTRRIENYEAKKTHYGPAIERVLAIIDRGVLDRLTVNGEILRLQSDMKRTWTALQAEMRDVDIVLEEITGSEDREKQLRDSVSTVLSSQRSMTSSMLDTPVSSPASSVKDTSRQSSIQGSRTPTPLVSAKLRQSSYADRGASRASSRTPSGSTIPKRTPLTRNGGSDFSSRSFSSPAQARAPSRLTPSRLETPPSDRPRWTSGMQPQSRDFLPLSALEPSPYAKSPITPKTNFLRSSGRQSTISPTISSSMKSSRSVSTPTSLPSSPSTRKSSLAIPTQSTPARTSSPLVPKSASPAFRPSSRVPTTTTTTTRRSSLLAVAHTPPSAATADGNEADTESPSHHKSRSPSALAASGGGVGGATRTAARSRSRLDSVPAGQEGKAKWRP